MKKIYRFLLFCLPVLLVFVVVQATAESDSYAQEEESVVPGVEVFLENHLDWVEGKNVGLVTNMTAVDRDLNSASDLLHEHPDVNLTALYGPEHGIRGGLDAGEYVESYIDERTGLPVHSLYPIWKPTEEMIEDVDVLLFDIQDIGPNFYTYIYTLGYVMEAAAEYDKSVIVLDRPNAIGGERVEGPILSPELVSFQGRYLLPVRHGMTPGELAVMWNHEYGLGIDLKVAEVDNWQRDMHFEDTGLPWVMTSPNIPTPDSASLYTGTYLIGTSFSSGLGTTRPFEFVGAPWINAEELKEELDRRSLDGVSFRAAYFTPMFGAHANELVAGVQVHIDDAGDIDLVELGLEIDTAMRDQDPSQYWANAGIGSEEAVQMLNDGKDAEEIIDLWRDDLNMWMDEVRNNYLLYGPYPEEVDKYENQPVLGILPLDLDLAPGQEKAISLHGVDKDGNALNPDRQLVDWDISNDIAMIDGQTIKAVDEGEATLTANYQGLETEVPVRIAMNIIDDVAVGVHDQHTRTVIRLNMNSDYDLEVKDGEVVVSIPYAELDSGFESGEIVVENSPVLERVDYELDGDTFVATLNLLVDEAVVTEPFYDERIVIDLVHE